MSKRIITISREFGSGGRVNGEEIAKKLGIAYYDKESITQIAENSLEPNAFTAWINSSIQSAEIKFWEKLKCLSEKETTSPESEIIPTFIEVVPMSTQRKFKTVYL